MFYYLVSLILTLVLSGALLAGLAKSLQVNWSRRNRRPLSFLAPVVLTLAFLLLTLQTTVPRLLDLVNLASQDYTTETVRIESGSLGWNTWNDGSRVFFYDQWRLELQDGKTYEIQFMPRSLYIIRSSEITNVTEPEP